MRLFVAVWPPPEVVAAVRAAVEGPASPARGGARAGDGAGGAGARTGRAGGALRWTAPEQWHVTLRFLGDARLDEAVAAFRAVAWPEGAPVVAEVGPATGRFGRRVLHVPVVGLAGPAAAVVAATREVGRPPEDRPFAGHLTLARARAGGGTDLSPWCGVPVSGRWAVGEVTLVASRTHRSGARYEVVDRLFLPGPSEGPCPNTRSQLH